MTSVSISARLDLFGILCLLGAAQGLLLALALALSGRGRSFAARALAALVFCVSVFVCGAVLRTSAYVFALPHLAWVHDPFPFACGPLLYLYLRAITSESRRPARRDLAHFVPFALCAAYLLPSFFQGTDAKLSALALEYTRPTLGGWYYVRSALVVTHFLAYLAAVVPLLWRYARRAKAEGVAASDRAALAQIRFLVAACACIWVAAVLRLALDQTARTNLLVPLLVSGVVYGLGYMNMAGRGSEADEGEAGRAPPPPTEDEPAAAKDEPAAAGLEVKAPTKYERSTLTPERAERYLKRLLEVMESERPYTDGDLNLQKLAGRLSITSQHLSQTVNGRLNQTFSDFVNSYRVEEAKRRLTDPRLRHYSVLAIAGDVGFNSKSSFNAVFKKHTGMTPSEFRTVNAVR
jgi:AraC-like DNA-binding protein